MLQRTTPATILALLTLTGGAAADTLIGDITWTAGSTINLNEDTRIQGNLMIEPGVTVLIASGADVIVEAGGSLTVAATQDEPALFTAATDRWGTLVFQPGSMGTLERAIIEKTADAGVRIDASSPAFFGCEIRDVRSSLSASTALTSPTAGEVVNGGSAFGMHLINGANPTVERTLIHNIEGGRGVSRTFRVTQPTASNGANGSSFNQNGGNGSPGALGLPAYNAGHGGAAAGLRIESGSDALVRDSRVFQVRGGQGGSGLAEALRVESAASRVFFVQNTVARIASVSPVGSAAPGNRGARGFGGNAGSPGFGGCDGSDGSDGALGNNAAPGMPGDIGATSGLAANSPASVIQIQATNNILSTGAPADAVAVFAAGSSIIVSDSNCFDGWGMLNGGSGSGSLGFAFVVGDPMFADAGADDFRPTAGSPVIDAGDSNQAAPYSLAFDIAGRARIFDDPETSNTGLGTGPIDMGAHEFGPDVSGCSVADLAEPFDVINVFDLFGYLNLYGAGDPAADLADPSGVINVFDLFEYLAVYAEGCP